MIAKITRGTDMAGLVRYLCGPGRHDEHEQPHVVAASAGLDVPVGMELTAEQRQSLASQLDVPLQLRGGQQPTGGYVWHLSLTNRADDRELSRDEWAKAVREAMVEMGFDSPAKAQAPWVAFHHGRSSSGNDHVHVAVSLVREDGTVASNYRDRSKLSAVCQRLEQRFGLMVVDGRDAGSMPHPTRGEQESARRRGRCEPDRVRLQRTVRAAAQASRDEAEFVRRLRAEGVLSRVRYAAGDKTKVTGYSVAVAPEAGQSPVWFGGGRLAKDLTLPKLRQGWAEVEDQGAAWGREGGAGREAVAVDAEAWAAAAERTRKALQRLESIPAEDRAGWADAARETAGAMSALARRLERDEPGPLSAAADSLGRSAQMAERSSRRVGLDGLATVATQAVIASRAGSAGWVIVAVELTRMMRAIEDAHVARGELVRAQEMRQRAETVLASVEADRVVEPSEVAAEIEGEERGEPTGAEDDKTAVKSDEAASQPARPGRVDPPVMPRGPSQPPRRGQRHEPVRPVRPGRDRGFQR